MSSPRALLRFAATGFLDCRSCCWKSRVSLGSCLAEGHRIQAQCHRAYFSQVTGSWRQVFCWGLV